MKDGGTQSDSRAAETALRRLEELVVAVDRIADPSARECARELLELTLDLHGLALARVVALAMNSKDAAALTEGLIADVNIRAVLLLHGLHPEDAETRLRKTIAAMRPHWGVRGIRVDLVHFEPGLARVRAQRSAGVDGVSDAELRREVEEILIEAAPDLDDIIVEGLEEDAAIDQGPAVAL